MRALFKCLLVVLLPRTTPAQGVGHIESPSRWSVQRVDNAALAERIRIAAATYRSYAPVPRVAFFDVAYPVDSAEFIAMNGYALLVVTALVQDSSELPLARTYVRSSKGVVELTPVFTVRSLLGPQDTLERNTFGRFRADAVFLSPVVPTRLELLADFATHRREFRLGQLGQGLPKVVERFAREPHASALPSREAVAAMLRRDYPDLARFFSLAP